MLYKIVLACGVAAASAGSVELISGNLGGPNRGLDNIKGTWSQALKVFGRDATISAEYNRNENENFLSEVSLAGTSGKVQYELVSKLRGTTDYTLSTTTPDGTTLEAEGAVDGTFGSGIKDVSLSKLTATRSIKADTAVLGKRDCDMEVSHDLSAAESKIKLSTILGSGLKAIGSLTSTGKSSKMSYEVEYDTTLSEGRTLTATVSPADGTGEIEYMDTATIDATLTATFPLGGSPTVTLRRSFGF
mmetsp:Transcript_11787/g.23997  ORF Transcript_11787/g.23997 Transcript_11787/m.23997 type:complete len:246 (-) Transcript_11787:180-917(-)|eukprot:CAMPEP_0119069674 /NCGR_PEP_ID=MMETSP1178-20130426/25879_1 /TAXON_ID=33656 /ORGANISM="unid sp, Strain CCMP2000" /LENGTH=245 /DNA_ID=CAMNT_0007051459 /DNA_START=30 /DNA_END=767 /DNA_ORIENTATION=+